MRHLPNSLRRISLAECLEVSALAAPGDAQGHRRREFRSGTRLPRVLSCNMQVFMERD
jgi:hypothetical protein